VKTWDDTGGYTTAMGDAELAVLEARLLCTDGAALSLPKISVNSESDGDETTRAAWDTEDTPAWGHSEVPSTKDAVVSVGMNEESEDREDSAGPCAVEVKVMTAPHVFPAGHQKPGGPCDHCGAVDSPQWRRGPASKPMLCNACGTRYRRTNHLGNAPSRTTSPEKKNTPVAGIISPVSGPQRAKKNGARCGAVGVSHRNSSVAVRC
jgi:hypothetical protein